MRWLRKNIAADGDGYLERLGGWSSFPPLFPSAEGRRNRDLYETWIERLVGYINTPAVGFWILGGIVSAGAHRVIIKPWMPPDEAGFEWEKPSPDNPYVHPDDVAGTTKPGEVAYRKQHEMSSGRTVEEVKLGTGQGSDCVVRFTPWFLPALDYWKAKPGWAPDEVLLHELVHALDFMTAVGTMYSPAPRGFGNLEEFSAVLFTNLYSSQTKRVLRKSHDGNERLPENLWDPRAFFAEYREQVLDVRERHRDLAGIYASWDVQFLPFNPFRIAAAGG